MNGMRYSHHSHQIHRPSPAKRKGGAGKRRRKSGLARVLRKKRKLLFVIGGALLLIAAALVVLLVVVLPAKLPAQETQAVSYFGDGDELDPSYYTEVQKAATAGSSGASAVGEAAVSELIGVVTDGADTQSKQLILQKIEEAASTAMDENRIEGVRFYDSGGSSNQQIQDVRSLLNAGAKALIFDVSDIDVFKVIAGLAEDANVPVVAINAPMDAGYTINIRTDNDQYGVASAQFIASKLSAGSYVTVTATDDEAEAMRIDNIKKLVTGLNQAASKGSSAAFGEYLETNAMPQAVVTAGCAYDVVYQMINIQKFPQIVAGEATAGLLRLLDTLRTGGVDIEIMPEMGEGDDPLLDPNATETDATLQIQIVNVKAPSLKFAAESGPAGVGGFALECALRLASGMTPREQAFPGGSCDFDACVLITEDNLAEHINKIKDMPDDYVIALWPSGSEIDAMFDEAKGGAE